MPIKIKTTDGRLRYDNVPEGTDGIVPYKKNGLLISESVFSYDETKDILIVGGVKITGGATLPSSPAEGTLFFHTPTGRKILTVYANSVWNSIISFGTMTVYVDGASGSDSADKGTGTGSNAFATIQYAINQIPSLVGGNVTVNIAAGTYAENVILRDKNYTGNYTITLQGTLTQLDSLTSSASTQGTGATQGTVVRSSGTWTSNQRQHKLVRFTSGTNNGVTRLIDSNNTTTLTIVERWSGGAPATDTFVVEDWAVDINPTSGAPLLVFGQPGVTLKDIKFTGDSSNFGLTVTGAGAQANITNCHFYSGAQATGLGRATFTCCYFEWANTTVTRCVWILDFAYGYLSRSKVNHPTPATAIYGVSVSGNSQFYFRDGSIIAATSLASGSNGIYMESGSVGDAYTTPSHNKITNWGTGIRILSVSALSFTLSGTYITHSGNTTNTSADGASGGYLP